MGFMKHWMCENCYAIMTNLNENDDKCVCTYCKSVYDRKELEAKSRANASYTTEEEAIKKILIANEGFKATARHRYQNMREKCYYHITGGELIIRHRGKDFDFGEKFDTTAVANEDQLHMFLSRFFHKLALPSDL